MHCIVYRSTLREYTYLYLAEGRDWEELPEDLQRMFGAPVEVLTLDLDAASRLARADIESVRQRLRETGYFLQLPPRHRLEDEIEAGLT